MSYRGLAGLMRAGSALGLLIIASTQVQAGGFALREQSAYGQGVSFAGVAAGGALSSMYWNPAVMTQYSGKALEADLSVIIPKASHSYSNSNLGNLLGGAYRNGVEDSGNDAVLPSTYASWQLNRQLWLGLSVNSPFGLGVTFPTRWAGAGYGQDSDLKSFNFAPSLAFKFNDMLSVAAGLQAQYMTVSYKTLTSAATAQHANISGAGYAYGFVVGATITPMPGTVIGIGYRSALDQKINGSLLTSSNLGPTTTVGSVNLTLDLPDMLTVGLRQRINDRFMVMAGFEWSNWSRIGTPRLYTGSGANATIGGTAVTFPFEYSDGYLYSLGGEYLINPSWTVRAGIAFEKSPITDGVRTPRLPDNDRMWYSAGFSYKPPLFAGVTVDAGYSFIDVKDTSVNLGPGTGNPWSNSTGAYSGSVDSTIHILSFGFRYQWDEPAPRKTALITK